MGRFDDQAVLRPGEIESLPYYDHAKGIFRIWVVQGDTLVEIAALDAFSAHYVSERSARPGLDPALPLSTIVARYFSYDDVTHYCSQACEDLSNGLAYIEKYFLFLQRHQQYGTMSLPKITGVELEGALGNHRSFYDLIHNVTCCLCRRFVPGSRTLPTSFRKMVQKSEREMKHTYRLPEEIIAFYDRKRELFMSCRDVRDAIYHRGLDPLFEALGWDERDVARTALRYLEVITEDSLDVQGHQKAPDYGWSGKASPSILTDFEELAVYDCTLRRRPSDKASYARIQYLRFEEYPVKDPQDHHRERGIYSCKFT